jgi:DNA repair exonuclease SbcCD ATPase subunit
LVNFQGIPSMEIDLGGRSASIYGDNGTGKTTIYNAITWLLFDKPSTGAKNWSPKTRGADGEKHNMEHSATATFIDTDGRRVTFGKTLKEVYKKKRGSMTSEYSGNTVDYFLDGVPVKEKEYTAAVAAQCGGDEMLKMLTMPDYFPETMEWKKRRELLLEICGDVTDAQVIASSADLADLPGYLLKPGTTDQYYTVEEYSKIAKARKTDINKQLETIPNRIDEVQRSIPADIQDVAELERQLQAATQAADDVRQEIAGIRAGGAEAIQSELAAARAALAEAKANYTRENADAQVDAYAAIKRLDAAVRDAERRAEDAKADAQVKRQQAVRLGHLRESILAEYRDAQAAKWDDARETCPTCGRRLPETDIETMRADFNERRSEKLAAINERGRREASKDMIADLEAQAQALDEKAAQATAEATEAKEKLAAVEKGIVKAPDFEETAAYQDAQAKIDRMQAAAGDVEASKAQAMAAADARLQECLGKEHAIRGQIIQVEAAEKQRARLAELEAQEKQLAAEYENVEHGVYLCELFTKTKVSLLTSRINAKFKSVSFQLFTEQVNGGLSECCEVLVPCDGAMVPYATANHAARVNAGLEICATVAAHYGQEMPVIVDNAESVTKLIDTDGQVIRLVVSEADKDLRVEVVA